MDVPVLLPENSSFTQLLDLTKPDRLDAAARSITSIPTNIQHGRPDASRIADLFNIADLDRVPEPVVRTPPVFPHTLKQDYPQAQVRVGFIVTSRGDVIQAYIVSSPNPGFDRPTLDAVEQWKFRPGIKGGRKVNTRVEQPINFKVSEDE
jgi:protein TonB